MQTTYYTIRKATVASLMRVISEDAMEGRLGQAIWLQTEEPDWKNQIQIKFLLGENDI